MRKAVQNGFENFRLKTTHCLYESDYFYYRVWKLSLELWLSPHFSENKKTVEWQQLKILESLAIFFSTSASEVAYQDMKYVLHWLLLLLNSFFAKKTDKTNSWYIASLIKTKTCSPCFRSFPKLSYSYL